MKKKNKKINKHQEFSKKVINAMILLWFVVAAFDMVIIVTMIVLHTYDSIQMMLSDLLTFSGVPISGGILGYLIKSAIENKEKIKGSYHDDTNPFSNDSG